MFRTLSVLAVAILTVAPRVEAFDTLTVNAGESIREAIIASSPGDTIRVKKGVYRPNIMEADGNPGIIVDVADITLIGDGAVIDGDYQGDGFRVTASGVTIRGFTIVNCLDGIFGSGVEDDAGTLFGVTITRNRVEACSDVGIELIEVEGAVVTHNIVEDCAGKGILVRSTLNPIASVDVSRNRARFNGDDGIAVRAASARVESNTADHNNDDGIDVGLFPSFGDGIEETLPTTLIKGNTAKYNAENGIEIDDEGGQGGETTRNNCSFNGHDGISYESGAVEMDGLEEPNGEFDHTLSRNTLNHNNRNGMDVLGTDVLVERNRADANGQSGYVLSDGGNIASGNRATNNGQFGMNLGGEALISDSVPDGPDGGKDPVVAVNNRLTNNGLDGLFIDIDFAFAIENRCERNRADGIRVTESTNLVRLVENRCFRNISEGISNSGMNTDIEDNSTGGNALGAGVDIAGAGNGSGTVNDFFGNTGTGGELANAGVDALSVTF